MSQTEGMLALESLRFGQHATLIPCYICEERNTWEAELCCHCFAPMALAHQALAQKAPPRLFATIGTSGVGKTVYLGMLMDMLSRQPSHLHLLARGAFSITLQQQTAGSLARCEFPDKTPNEPDRWNWVHCQISSPLRKKAVEMVMPDMPGEAIVEEVEHPRTYPAIRSLLQKSLGVLIVLDTVQLHQGSFDQDYFAMKLVSYLLELDNSPKTGWSRRAVGFVLTKADECEECFDDPADYARTHASGLWQLCQKQLQTYRFFATSVAGGCVERTTSHGRIRAPLRIEPRGVMEPFDWLIHQLK